MQCLFTMGSTEVLFTWCILVVILTIIISNGAQNTSDTNLQIESEESISEAELEEMMTRTKSRTKPINELNLKKSKSTKEAVSTLSTQETTFHLKDYDPDDENDRDSDDDDDNDTKYTRSDRDITTRPTAKGVNEDDEFDIEYPECGKSKSSLHRPDACELVLFILPILLK